jgi:hypothetical protein
LETSDLKEMIGYCGYSCHLCGARSKDPKTRQQLVDGWRKYFGHQNYTAENVQCDGCRSKGRHADQQCTVRPCAEEKGIKSCAVCDEFACAKIRPLLASREGLLCYGLPRIAGLTEDEYNLCMRQFEGLPNLIRIMVETGKAPAWWRCMPPKR